jgi:hypothetical protein
MKVRNMIVLAALVLAAPVFAHGTKGPNGGQVADVAAYHIELVTRNEVVEVYVIDAATEKPLSVKGFKALAILTVGGKPQRIVLDETEPTRLSGKAAVPLPNEPKGVVQLTMPDGKTANARFQ